MYSSERSDACYGLTHPDGDVTAAVFPTRPPSITAADLAKAFQGPVSARSGVIACGAYDGSETSQRVLLVPLGLGDAGQTFEMRVHLWRPTRGGARKPLWVPVLTAAYTITLGPWAGVDGSDLDSSHLFASTIVQTFGPDAIGAGEGGLDGSFNLSPGAAGIGLICMRTLGARFVEVTFQLGTATGANCLYAKL
jgi:hypothetical protein